MATDWIESCDPTQIRNEVLPRLEKDIAGFEAGLVPSNLCISIPKLNRRGGKIHAIIAEMLFSEHVEDQINELRQKLESKRAKKERIEVENNGNLKSVEIDDDRREESNEKTGKTGERVKSEDYTMKSGDFEAVITDDDLMTRLKARWNSRLDVLLTKMRNSITKARDERRKFAKRAPEPVEAVEQPEAVSMDRYPDAEEFKDVIEFLMNGCAVATDSTRGEESSDSIQFEHGNINSDGRLDLCKQGFRNAFTQTCKAVIKDGEQETDSVIFKHGNINRDGRLDLCKQGFRNAFTETCEAVIKDGEQKTDSVIFKHGNINGDGRLDLCKQGFRNAFTETCEAVIKDGAEPPDAIRFNYGALNSDGRFDMCKQGFRNAFVNTCKAVENGFKTKGKRKPLVRHYLIGNNRIAEDGGNPGEGDRRVAALTRMIRHRPDILTWYLAGNSLDNEQIRLVAEAVEQTRTKYVWLKMNPVKTGAYYLGKMLVRTPSIELLDLFNCGLCNDGVEEFARGLAEGAAESSSTPYSNLRHLYISINAIRSTKPVEQLLFLLPQLESFFLGVNPFGDKGFIEISDAIIKVPCRNVLQRLNVGSMALTDASLPYVKDIVKACPTLVCLELGSYKSTNYFGEKHNRFDVKKEETRSALKEIARALMYNAEMLIDKDKAKGVFPLHYLGLQHALVVDACPSRRTMRISEAKVIIDDVTKNQLHHGTGINVNGITNLYSSRDGKTYWHNGEWEVRDKYVTDASSCRRVTDKNASSRMLVAGGVFFQKEVTSDMQLRMKNPWPAIDYIKSIYRSVMKT